MLVYLSKLFFEVFVFEVFEEFNGLLLLDFGVFDVIDFIYDI